MNIRMNFVRVSENEMNREGGFSNEKERFVDVIFFFLLQISIWAVAALRCFRY